MTRKLLATLALAAALVLSAQAGAAAGSSRLHCFIRVRAGGSAYLGRVTRSVRTSCPFARNVARASLRFVIRHGGAGDGDFYVFAWSPVTRRWYRTHCFADGDLYSTSGSRVDCRAGHGARVVYRASAVG